MHRKTSSATATKPAVSLSWRLPAHTAQFSTEPPTRDAYHGCLRNVGKDTLFADTQLEAASFFWAFTPFIQDSPLLSGLGATNAGVFVRIEMATTQTGLQLLQLWVVAMRWAPQS